MFMFCQFLFFVVNIYWLRFKIFLSYFMKLLPEMTISHSKSTFSTNENSSQNVKIKNVNISPGLLKVAEFLSLVWACPIIIFEWGKVILPNI